MTIACINTPTARTWTLANRPRAPFVRLVIDNGPSRRDRLVATWSLTGSGRLVRAWSADGEPSVRKPSCLFHLPALFRRAV